jgi:hypothetical protein
MEPNTLQQYLTQFDENESNPDERTSSVEDRLFFESNQEEFQNDHTAIDISTEHNVGKHIFNADNHYIF